MADNGEYPVADVEALREQRDRVHALMTTGGMRLDEAQTIVAADLVPGAAVGVPDMFAFCQNIYWFIGFYYGQAEAAATAGDTKHAMSYQQFADAWWSVYIKLCGPVVVVD